MNSSKLWNNFARTCFTKVRQIDLHGSPCRARFLAALAIVYDCEHKSCTNKYRSIFSTQKMYQTVGLEFDFDFLYAHYMLIFWNGLNPLEAFVWTNPVREAQRISQQDEKNLHILFWCCEFENCYWLDSYLQISTGFYFAYICVIIPWHQQPYSFFQNSELRGVDCSTTPGWLATHWVGRVFSFNRFFRIERCKEQELVMLLDKHQPLRHLFCSTHVFPKQNFDSNKKRSQELKKWFIVIWMFPKIMGTPKSSILIGFSIIFTIHFGGKPTIFGNTQL